LGIVVEEAQCLIAVRAQESTHDARDMVVVNVEYGARLPTDGALRVLRSNQRGVPLLGKSIREKMPNASRFLASPRILTCPLTILVQIFVVPGATESARMVGIVQTFLFELSKNALLAGRPRNDTVRTSVEIIERLVDTARRTGLYLKNSLNDFTTYSMSSSVRYSWIPTYTPVRFTRFATGYRSSTSAPNSGFMYGWEVSGTIGLVSMPLFSRC
jgi:hypothetical protein